MWDDRRVEAALRSFLAGHTEWPTKRTFLDAGRGDLLAAVYTTGGPRRWALHLGVAYEPYDGYLPQRRLWTDERIRAELTDFCAQHHGQWPGHRAFVRAGRAQLYRAASLYGGIPQTA